MFPAVKNIAKLNIDDIVEGEKFSFEEVITEKMVDKFAELSGDYNSLHMVEEFARKRDFNGRVVHGVLSTSLLSRLVGMHLPGENAFLLSMNTQFVAPAYLGDRVRIDAEVAQISTATKTIVLKSTISNVTTQKILVRSKILVGFTNLAE